MNKITISLEIERTASRECRVRILRDGEGDDMIQTRADFILLMMREALEEMQEIERISRDSK